MAAGRLRRRARDQRDDRNFTGTTDDESMHAYTGSNSPDRGARHAVATRSAVTLPAAARTGARLVGHVGAAQTHLQQVHSLVAGELVAVADGTTVAVTSLELTSSS